MSTRSVPETTLSDLAGELAKREDVLGVKVHNEAEYDWRDPWLELVIDNPVIPAEVCALLGEHGFGVSDTHPPQLGQTHREIEIKADVEAER